MGPTRARKIVDHFGSAEAVFHASLTELEATGMQAASAQSIATGKSAELAREEIARAAEQGAVLVCCEDSLYPPRLKEIYDPPLLLYVRGNAELLKQPGIAMVGTRHPTPYGLGMAERLRMGWSSLAEWRAALTQPVIAARFRRRERPLRYWAPEWT
jgi:DNA processing protein